LTPTVSLIHTQHKGPAFTGWPFATLESSNMTRLIIGLEVHRYAPELNKLHLRNRQTLSAPGITTIKEAKARLFGRWQPGHREPSRLRQSLPALPGATGKPDRTPRTPDQTAPAPQRARHHHLH